MSDPTSAGVQNIIIKKKKVVAGDGHHGGAWKVAYADFVTAMMAFFLLMWLLNATTEDQRKGIADYFNPSIPISRISGGGSDGLNGSSVFTEDTLAKMGTGASRKESVGAPKAEDAKKGKVLSEAEITKNFNQLKEQLAKSEGKLSQHVTVKLSSEGIVLELVDSDDDALFTSGRSDATPLLKDLMEVVSGSFTAFENDIKLVGHTDNLQFRSKGGYDNWSLSSDRANTARRILVEAGVAPVRIAEVSGRADTDPLIPDNPAAAQNRRISIVILTK